MDQLSEQTRVNFCLPATESCDLIDLLDRKGLVTACANMLQVANLPCTIAVTGEWGVGKTWFLKFLQKELNSRDSIVLWFDLWKYEATGNVLYALAEMLLEESGVAKQDRLRKDLLDAAAILGKPVMAALAFSAGMPQLATAASPAIDHIRDRLTPRRNRIVTPEQAYSSVQKLQSGFNEAIDRIVEKKSAGDAANRVVILIDDIDRCFPASIESLLTGIKNYISSGEASTKCAFVLAVDESIAEAAIAKTRLHGKNTNRWLEKLFTFRIRIPATNRENFSPYCKEKIKSLFEQDKLPEFHERFYEELSKALALLPTNPRRWNRLVSDSVYFWTYEDRKAKLPARLQKHNIDECTHWLIGLLGYKHFFPDVYDVLIQVPQLYDRLASWEIGKEKPAAVNRPNYDRIDAVVTNSNNSQMLISFNNWVGRSSPNNGLLKELIDALCTIGIA